ncbi:MAG: C1 family peptidase [Bacteroidales bacterium]|nr:C1 family peptidase [Bacteroidales bacterium]
MKITILSFITLYCVTYAIAQKNGEINKTMLENFRTEFNSSPETKSMMNAVSSNDIQKLALDRDNLGDIDTHFSHRIKTKGITDQKSTGRCWLFTGMNVLRAKVIEEKKLEEFSFSHNYNFFYDQLEKANLFLEWIISTADMPMDNKKVEWLFKNAIGDGGQWTGVVDIIEKYGLVPAEVFPESFNSENTRWMSRFLRRKLKEDGLALRAKFKAGIKEKELRAVKEGMLSEAYRILAISLGEPPQKFSWRYEEKDGNLSELSEYTPISFYKEFVNINLNDYIMFMNDPTREYGKLYEIEYDRHIYEGGNWKYINLENEKIKEFAMASIQNNDAMYFSCDVGKQLDKNRGCLDVNNYDYEGLFGVEFGMDKKQRIRTFESGSTHGMALMGVDIVEDRPVKWLLENSWGDSGFQGHLIMTDQWFDEYMFRLVIHKKYIEEETLNILKKTPIYLPPWDPMFLPDN